MNQHLGLHLNDQQITAWMLGERGPEAATHIAGCAQCRAETEALSGTISGFRATVHAATPPDVKWSRVALALSDAPRTWPGLAASLVAVAALLIVSSLLLMRAPQPAVSNSHEAADEALLLQIQSDVGRYEPLALAPAQTIAEERASILVENSKQSSKSSKENQ